MQILILLIQTNYTVKKYKIETNPVIKYLKSSTQVFFIAPIPYKDYPFKYFYSQIFI